MPVTIEEMLVKLGVDASQAKQASAEAEKLRETIKSIGPTADTSLIKAAAKVETLGQQLAKFGNDGGENIARINAKANELLQTLNKIKPPPPIPPPSFDFNPIISGVKSVASAITDTIKSVAQLGADAFFWVEEGAKKFDALAKQSRSLGIPVEHLQKLNSVGVRAGINVDQLNDAIRTLNKNIESNLIGTTGESTKGFELLGLSVKSLKDLPTIERLKKISSALVLLKTDTERATASARIFGEFGGFKIQSLLSVGGEGLQQALDAAGAVSASSIKQGEELTVQFGVMRGQINSLRNTVLSAAIPTVRKIVDATNDWLTTNRAWLGARLEEGVSLVSNAVDGLLPLAKDVASSFAQWVKENHELIRQELPAKLKEAKENFLELAGAVGTLIKVGRGVVSVFSAVNTVVGGGLTRSLEKLERIRQLQLEFDKRTQRSDDERLKQENRQRGSLIALPRIPSKQDVERAKAERDRLKQEIEQGRRNIQESNRRVLELGKVKEPKKAKKKAPKSGITADEVIESLLFGESPQEEIKGLAAVTPSTKDIKPTVAIDYFNFTVTQHFNTSDPVRAGAESAQAIQDTFRKGTARGTSVGNVVR